MVENEGLRGLIVEVDGLVVDAAGEFQSKVALRGPRVKRRLSSGLTVDGVVVGFADEKGMPMFLIRLETSNKFAA